MSPLILAWALQGLAHAEEYREFALSDGRIFVAAIDATEVDGFRVHVPQGDLAVSFASLANMADVDATAYADQRPWDVYLNATPDVEEAVGAALARVPRVRVLGRSGAPTGTPDASHAAARACGTDLECAVSALRPPRWTWVVVARREGTGVVLEGGVTHGAARTRIVLPDAGPDRLAYAVFDVLGGSAPADFRPEAAPASPVVAKTEGGPTDAAVPGPEVGSMTTPTETGSPTPTREPRPWTDARVVRASFVPLPGYPSLAQGDAAGFALAWAVVLPSAAAVVAASGAGSQGPAEHALLAASGIYATTVVANQALGKRSLDARVGLVVAPDRDGARVVAAGRF
jgi:hypothetical protein